MRRVIIIGSILLLFASCRTQNLLEKSRSELELLEIEFDSAFYFNPNYEYRIQRGDKLSISVWGHDDLSVGSAYAIYNANEVSGRWLMVDAKGNVAFPKIGDFYCVEKTTDELKNEIVDSLKTWIKDPIVDIKVINKSVTVLGEVNTPGTLTIERDQRTLLDIIAESGGPGVYANLKYVQLLRQDGENVRMLSVNLSESGDYFRKNILVHPGDVVLVPAKRYKEFDRRISIIIPFTTAVTAGSILLGLF